MLARIVLSILISLGFGFLTQPLQAQTVLDTVCAGARGVHYQVDNVQGSTFNWKIEGGEIANGNGTNQVFIDWGKDTGIFPIEVVQYNAQGCPGESVRAFVWIRGGIEVSINGPQTICEGDLISLKATGAKSFKWSTGYPGNEILIRPSVTKEYIVTGYSDKCGMDTASFVVEVNKKPHADILINPDDPKLNEWVRFANAGKSGNSGAQSQWSFNDGTSVDQGDDVNRRYTQSGNYKVRLIVIDPNGCADTAFAAFSIKADPQVFIPDAFSPNGDGLNDVFEPVTSDVNFVKLQIFNRWGEKVYSGENYYAKWDGSFGGQIVPEGVYVYTVEAIGVDGKLYTYNGTLTVIK
ncbi:MAG: T9SS type B sorting domain-containing protein [Bacteroidetes bacterium]|nr:T9SS type B sorting domain-containing protein [Bacteroidota bacterium]